MPLDLATSQRLIAVATEKASELGIQVSVAVVDSGGNLVAFGRMDGAEIAGPTLAVDKAYTAISNRTSTEELGRLAQPGGPLYGLHSNGGGRYVMFGGGIPIFDEQGEAVGAIGVSGAADVAHDVAAAEAAVSAFSTF